MIGAIAGDIIGSTYERINARGNDIVLFRPFSRYTDDTVMTMATIDCLLNGGDFSEYYRSYFFRNPMRGYGTRFFFWSLLNKKEPNNSMGNGSAMRVSPIGYKAQSLEEVMLLSKESACITHNHPEGIKGAQAIAVAVFLGHNQFSKSEIKEKIESLFNYDLSTPYEEIKETYRGGETCPLTVPPAIISFLASEDYEDAIKRSIALGGDSDTLACMAGGIAESYYEDIPKNILDNSYKKLPKRFKKLLSEFYERYG